MSALTLTQSAKAVGVNLTASFLALGGTPPYTYVVRTNPAGAGGTVDSSTGLYIAPSVVNGGSYGPPKQLYDTIQVIDSLGARAYTTILVGNALLLFCEVIQNYMGLANGRVYLWDQKITEPSDAGAFIAVSVLRCQPFANTNKFDGNGNAIQSMNMFAQLSVDIISRDTEARDRKEEILMAIKSDYAQNQQTANSFYIGKLPPGQQFVNLSDPDGAAIPYRFNIAVALQYFYTKTVGVPYFDTFQAPDINTNP